MTHQEQGMNQTHNDSDKKKRKRLPAIIIALIVAAIVVALVVIAPWKNDEEPSNNNDEAAPTISEDVNPTVSAGPTRSVTPEEVVGDDGRTSYLYKAPEELGLGEDDYVDPEVARRDPNEPFPADPREAIKKTLTAPTTARPGEDIHEILPYDPRTGAPKSVAEGFTKTLFTLCVENDTSYAKNLKENQKLVTSDFYRRGLNQSWDGTKGRSLSWGVYAAQPGCANVNAYVTPQAGDGSVSGENTIWYKMNVRQQIISSPDNPGAYTRNNLRGFRVNVEMKFVDNKWLANRISIDGGRTPEMY